MKSKQTAIGLLSLVLTLGVVSCNRESHPKSENLRVPPPTFVRQDGSPMEFSAWSNLKAIDLSVHDEIHWTEALNDIRLDVDATCQTGETASFKTRTHWTQVQALNILQLLPSGVWLLGTQAPVICRLDFLAENSRGARHVFHLPDLRLKLGDSGLRARVKSLGQVVTQLDDRTLSTRRENHLRIWFEDLNAPVQLICQRVSASLNRDNQGAIDLDQVDWPAATPSRSREQCRIIAGSTDAPLALSPRFKIDLQPYRFPLSFRRTSISRGPFTLNSQLTNSSSETIYIRLRPISPELLEGYFVGTRQVGHRPTGLDFQLSGQSVQTFEVAPGIFALSPGAVLSFQLWLTPRGGCQWSQQQYIKDSAIYVVAKTAVGLQLVEPAPQSSEWIDAGIVVLLNPGETFWSDSVSDQVQVKAWSEIFEKINSPRELEQVECRQR